VKHLSASKSGLFDTQPPRNLTRVGPVEFKSRPAFPLANLRLLVATIRQQASSKAVIDDQVLSLP
jgi:hypothetical protein